jgi:hypothetical protein
MDDFQLEPVGVDPYLFEWEKKNRLFNPKYKIKLNEVKRNDGVILKIATHLRGCKSPEILHTENPDFKIVNRFTSQLPLNIRDDDDYMVLCSTNNKRLQYNKHIRKERFKEQSPFHVVENERLISVANTRLSNGEIYSIKNITIMQHFRTEINIGNRLTPEWREFDFYLVNHEIHGEMGSYTTIVVPYLDKPSLHPQMLMSSNDIKHNPALTTYVKEFNARVWKNEIIIATYGYATSVHKA